MALLGSWVWLHALLGGGFDPSRWGAESISGAGQVQFQTPSQSPQQAIDGGTPKQAFATCRFRGHHSPIASHGCGPSCGPSCSRSAALLVSNTPAGADISVPAAVAQPDAVVHPQPAHAIELTPATPPETKVLPAVAPELLIAQQIHQGHLPCELGASVRIEADATQPGFFHVHGKGFRYRMFPVQTSTGALRLEDKKAGAVWLQLANKSMLMDQKRGRRLADECAHPDQLAYAETMKTNPPPSLIDTKGLGR
jgi:hypothetical protein